MQSFSPLLNFAPLLGIVYKLHDCDVIFLTETVRISFIESLNIHVVTLTVLGAGLG